MKELILGGVKSGKSKLAECRASASQKEVIYIATAMREYKGEVDKNLNERIEQHKKQRPDTWQVIEEPLYLADIISTNFQKDKCLLVDCLTLWLTNLLLSDDDSLLKQEVDKLIKSVETSKASIIFVANETNLGVIPESLLARQFCDHAGILHQRLAGICDTVILTVAGLPHFLKGNK